MNNVMRLALFALVFAIGAPLGGCAVRGSSFETLGVPSPEHRPGRSPVIVGWAREDRAGWVIRRIRIDGTTRNEWNEDTQQPVIMYLEPGEHEFRFSAAQLSDPRDASSRPRRRYRIRPFQVDVLEAEAQLCVIRVQGDERRRPRINCEAYDYQREEEEEGYDEYGDEYDEGYDEAYEDEDEDPQRQPPPEMVPLDQQQEPEDEEVEEPADDTSAEAGETAQPSSEPVPSPFETPQPSRDESPEAAQPQAEAAPTVTPPTPTAAAEPATESRPPRPLSMEQRIERLERLVEELRREIRER